MKSKFVANSLNTKHLMKTIFATKIFKILRKSNPKALQCNKYINSDAICGTATLSDFVHLTGF